MKLFRIFLLLLPIAILGCNAEEQEAKKLGFANAEQMKQVHAKGWHTQKKYEEDTGIKNSEPVQYSPSLENSASLMQYVDGQKWSIKDIPCDFNGGTYEIFSIGRGLSTTLGGKEQLNYPSKEKIFFSPSVRSQSQYINYGATRFVYEEIFAANHLVERQLNEENVVAASIELEVIMESNVRLRTKKKITQLNYEKLMKGSKQYDTTTEDSFKLLCSSIMVKASPDANPLPSENDFKPIEVIADQLQPTGIAECIAATVIKSASNVSSNSKTNDDNLNVLMNVLGKAKRKIESDNPAFVHGNFFDIQIAGYGKVMRGSGPGYVNNKVEECRAAALKK